MHPFAVSDEEFAEMRRDLHRAILDLLGPVSRFVMHAERSTSQADRPVS